jgi:hypothetical protein
MALSRDDLTIDKGNIGYGTMASLPEPGSAGDLAAEAATAGIVNTDASAELAQQVPNIVVPLNPEVRGDDQFITNESSDSDRDIDTNTTAGITTLNTGNLGKYITKDRAISYGLSQVHPLLGLAYTTYKYFNPGMDQAIVDEAETARLADTPENAGYATESDKIMAEGDIAFGDTRIGTGTQDYDEYSDTPTYSTPASAYSYEGSDEQDEATNYAPEPEPTYTAPAPAPAPAPTYTYYDGGSDNDNDSDSGSGSPGSSGPGGSDEMGSFAYGGAVKTIGLNDILKRKKYGKR